MAVAALPDTLPGLLLARYEQVAFICRHGHQKWDDVLDKTILEVTRMEWAISRWTARELF